MIRVIYTHSASACKAALYFVQRYKGLESGKELFNGNISYSTYAINKFESGATAGYSYRYDQLNRLTAMNGHSIGNSNTSWGNSSIIDLYKEQITYDANGNIKTYKRNGDKAGSLAPMDDLKYGYTVDNNRLKEMVDFNEYDEYKGVDPKKHLISIPSPGQATDPDPAAVNDR